ncbi:related to SAP1-member of the AAA-protein family [Phialocephala subalpina]|uniref:Related to SAP1-member of the AAA-protein family n=1 Tax=Phialocephala subalpina TaxID=576137 RepID=A0A1L7WXU4_9HELO|nr:related to SAP1-member of the AAA-protein family [Phialocephala subalpina]
MMRNKTSSSLQKTYDECYLTCSTAVYFENKGNEAEALRSWRKALDEIYFHNAYRMPAGYVPRSETEKTLKDSLRDMELRCKERVDLLEALKQSREEKAAVDSPAESSNGKITKSASRTPRHSSEVEHNEKGFIGEGTIPAVSFPDLSRSTPPALPQRPAMLTKNSSEYAVVGSRPNPIASSSAYSASSSRTVTPAYSATLAPPMKKTSRSPSPEKGRTMLHTLRSGDKSGRKPSPRSSRSSGARRENPVTNKAASLAWQSVGSSSRDRLGRSLDANIDDSSTTLPDSGRQTSVSDPVPGSSHNVRYDKGTRTLVPDSSLPKLPTPPDFPGGPYSGPSGPSNSYHFPPTDPGQPGAVAGSMLTAAALQDLVDLDPPTPSTNSTVPRRKRTPPPPPPHSRTQTKLEPMSYPTYRKEYAEPDARKLRADAALPVRRKAAVREGADAEASSSRLSRKPVAANSSSPRHRDRHSEKDSERRTQRREARKARDEDASSQSIDDDTTSSGGNAPKPKKKIKQKQKEKGLLADPTTPTSGDSGQEEDAIKDAWEAKVQQLMKNLPKGVDEGAAKSIFNEIVYRGDEVHWDDVAGLDIAKKALKEAVVYPFLRPDLFMGLREPARGMLLFGPPGTGKTMLARAVATESRSTFFSISASSLTSKYLGESEKLVRALFQLAKALAPSIIFVDEIDSLLSSRSGSGEHESTRRIKTEFLIQWSDLQRAAAGREQSEKEKERGDASRVLVLAATNLPWAIDEAARRRFVRRQYIPLPEDETRATQLRTLLGHQKHSLDEDDIARLVELTDGFSGSDITALAKDAAMGPLRSLGEALLHMSMDEIRPIQFVDFEASLTNIRPSVSKQGLKEFEDWAKEFGERGG